MEAELSRSGTYGEKDVEHKLLLRCKRGDREAYGRLVENYQLRVYRMIARMVRDRAVAEELTQEAFLRGFLAMDRFDPQRPFLPWILRIATNLAINHLKSSARSEVSLPGDEVWKKEDFSAQEEGMARREELARVERALLTLEPDYRVPLVLKHVEGLSYQEISEITGLSLRVLKMRVHRARKKLFEAMAKEA